MNALRPAGALRPRRLKARNTAAAREAPERLDAALPLASTDAPAPRPALPVPSVARAVVPLRDPPRVSVVVTTRCRPELLRRCLHALLVQSFDAEAFEIIVVDDGHDGQTRTLVEVGEIGRAHV